MRITTADGREATVRDSAALTAEIDRFEDSLAALIPDLEAEDDEVGNEALGRYRVLAYHLEAILAQVDWWNEQVAEERRAARRRLAETLKARRVKS